MPDLMWPTIVLIGVPLCAMLLWQAWSWRLTDAERRLRSLRPLSNGRGKR